MDARVKRQALRYPILPGGKRLRCVGATRIVESDEILSGAVDEKPVGKIVREQTENATYARGVSRVEFSGQCCCETQRTV